MKMANGVELEQKDIALVESLVGRTVVAAEWRDDGAGCDWCGHEVAQLTLDDGRKIKFGAWGYDAWGATVTEVKDGQA